MIYSYFRKKTSPKICFIVKYFNAWGQREIQLALGGEVDLKQALAVQLNYTIFFKNVLL